MKFIHLSDLHIGKRINEFSMIEDQEYILAKILNIIDDEKPDAVIIAGDVYDKTFPVIEAVKVLDDFLVKLAERKLQVFMISGNHDSAERLSFGNRLMDATGVHISSVYDGQIKSITLSDEYGDVRVHLLPFIKPAHVRAVYPEEDITSYDSALRVAIKHIKLDTKLRNVLVTHQFVTGAEKSESEEMSVGGTDNIDSDAFDKFDYVALGHIHKPQNIGFERIRYCGTPLKYSFSEANDQKSVTVVELGKKDKLVVRTVPLKAKRDMVELKGSYEELTLKTFYDGKSYPNDYVHITLTDEDDIVDAIAKLRTIYPYLMRLDYDNLRTRTQNHIDGAENVENKNPIQLFSELYELQNGSPMTDMQTDFMQGLIDEIWEDM